MEQVRRFVARLDQMSAHTYAFLRGCLLLSCTMAACALLLLVKSGGRTVTGFELYKCAQELIALGASPLFFAAIGSAWIEELTMTGRPEPPRK